MSIGSRYRNYIVQYSILIWKVKAKLLVFQFSYETVLGTLNLIFAERRLFNYISKQMRSVHFSPSYFLLKKFFLVICRTMVVTPPSSASPP